MPTPQTEVLITVAGSETGRFVLAPGDYVIGRNADCAIRVEADLVSRTHAKLILNYDHALIEDLGSSNGTLVNGQPIPKDERTRLWPNQKIQVGAATIELRRLKHEASDESLAPVQAMVKRVLPEEFLREKRYDIGKIIAQGGMGAILDAREATIERNIAMKVMLDTNDPDALVRFLNEAKLTGQLEHPNIVPVHELGVDANGQVFYTMKMVQGITLKKVLELMADGVEATVKKYPLAALLTIFQKVCDALAFAHSKGVVHRDLKPENIMLGDYGEVLVMDWGLAKRIGNSESGERKPESNAAAAAGSPEQNLSSIPSPVSSIEATLAGTVMGTPQFMSPEQARGEIDRIDARSDIYSLGAILYQILVLRVSVTGTDVWEVVGKVGRGEIEPLDSPPRHQDAKGEKNPAIGELPSKPVKNLASLRLGGHLPGGRIPDSLAAVVRKAMSLGRSGRYQSVAELQRDIEAYQGGFATSAENAGAWKQFTLLVKRHKAAAIGIAAVLLVGSVLGTKAFVEGRRAQRALGDLKASAPSLLALAESEAAFQRFDSALVKLDAALALDPGLTAGWWRRAWLLLAQEKFAESAGAVRTAQRNDPANAARLGAILPLLDELQAAPAAGRWNPERSSAVLAHLNAAGANGEAIALSSRFQISAADKLKLVQSRLKEWLGKEGGNIQQDGSVIVNGLPNSIETVQPLQGLPIDNLDLRSTAVKDLEPLRGMPLHTLDLSTSKSVTDLSPLRGMRLRKLDIRETRVTDLSPLAGMPLTELRARDTSVQDLTPLTGMPLKTLILNSTKVRDLSPLKGMPLRFLDLVGTKVSDLSPLHGMPLESLNIRGTPVGDLVPLKGMPLQTLDAGFLQGGPLDASPLRGMPLKTLSLHAVDYSPFAGMEFDFLVPDPDPNLATLRGIRTTKLHIKLSGKSSANIEPLKDVRFKSLRLEGWVGIGDLSPLRDCREMEELSIAGCVAPLDPLRGHPTLKFIGCERPGEPPIPLMPVEKFWPAYDAQQAAAKK